LAKYVVILIVALWATHLLLSRRRSTIKTERGKSLHRAFESTLRKAVIAAVALIAVIAATLLVRHVTS
jgi:hypothetical protein